MPSEVRILTFTNKEITHAFQKYGKDSGMYLPNGVVTRTKGIGDKLIFDLRQADGQKTSIELAPAKVAACLFLLCRERKIPLPLAARKSIEIVANRLTLRMRIEEDIEKSEMILL